MNLSYRRHESEKSGGFVRVLYRENKCAFCAVILNSFRLRLLVMESLVCPDCGTKHSTYKSYFNCRSSHLKDEVSKVPTSHNEMVKYYYYNPQAIEKGMESVGYEVGVFRGRIDLILRDSASRLCLVDVTDEKNRDRKKKQFKKYKESLRWLANNVFQCKLNEPIRLILIHPKKGVEEVT